MKYILAYNEDLTFKGFYIEGVSKDIPSPNILVTKELWSYLVDNLKCFKLSTNFIEKDLYTIEDKELFEEVLSNDENVPQETPLDVRVTDLEQENANLILASVEHEIKLGVLEQDLADLMLEMSTMKEV